MISRNVERLRAHRNNIRRYRRLLATRLTDLERTYIERRLNEEQASMEALLRKEFPDRLFARLADRSAHRPETNLDMTALLHPADAFTHPMDVVEDCDLTTYEKRAILSSWAADACAVKEVAQPSRSSGAVVSFDDILDALRALDSEPAPLGDPGSESGRHSDRKKSGDTPHLDFS
jgi:hypothetical protein